MISDSREPSEKGTRLAREGQAEGRSFRNFIFHPSNPCHPTTLARLSRSPFRVVPIVCVKIIGDSFTKVSGRETVLQSFASAGPALFSRHRLQHDRPNRKDPL